MMTYKMQMCVSKLSPTRSTMISRRSTIDSLKICLPSSSRSIKVFVCVIIHITIVAISYSMLWLLLLLLLVCTTINSSIATIVLVTVLSDYNKITHAIYDIVLLLIYRCAIYFYKLISRKARVHIHRLHIILHIHTSRSMRYEYDVLA